MFSLKRVYFCDVEAAERIINFNINWFIISKKMFHFWINNPRNIIVNLEFSMCKIVEDFQPQVAIPRV